jgi:hypothetical protein
MSLLAYVLILVNWIVMNKVPGGAIIQTQFALLMWCEEPDPSEKVPVEAVSRPHDDPQPLHG